MFRDGGGRSMIRKALLNSIMPGDASGGATEFQDAPPVDVTAPPHIGLPQETPQSGWGGVFDRFTNSMGNQIQGAVDGINPMSDKNTDFLKTAWRGFSKMWGGQ